MGVFILILLTFSLLQAEELSFETERFSGVIKLMDKGIKMSWVKLREGGYMVSGKIPESIKDQGFVCQYLTDLKAEEVRNLILKNEYLPKKVPLRTLNAYVKVGKKPHLAKPEIYPINPTMGDYGEIDSEIVREVLRAMERDPSLRKRFNRYVEDFQREGLDPIEARREALKYVVGLAKIEVRRWLPEEKLPKRLYLYCHRALYETDTKPGKTPKSIYEVRLYPVELSTISEGHIRIEKVEVLKGDIRVVLTVPHTHGVPRNLPLDLITVNPPLAKGFRFKNYRYVYVGGYLYYGFNKDPNRGSYQIYLSSLGDKFYTIIAHQGEERTYELYIRLGYYGSNEPREEISMFNPRRGDDYYTGTLVDWSYTHRRFLKNLSIRTPVRLTFRIVSPEGYESEPFEVVIR